MNAKMNLLNRSQIFALLFGLVAAAAVPSNNDSRQLESDPCPRSAPGVACKEIFSPVVCTGDCRYSNDCFAKAAYFDVSKDCKPLPATVAPTACPVPDFTVACPKILDPSICAGTCLYDNKCLAEAAGFDLAVCERAPTPSPAIGIFCPVPDPARTCLVTPDRVLCPGDCVYASGCVAEGAGFNPTDCETIPGTGTGPTCPVPGPASICPAIAAPVVCTGGCEYGNLCLATASGFLASDCSSIFPTQAPVVDECAFTNPDIFCPALFDPVICANGCVYSNSCFASAAGAQGCNPATDSPVTPLTPPPSDCPISTSFCRAKFDPVLCEPGSCEYSNLCEALGAGFTAPFCESSLVVTPPPVTVIDPVCPTPGLGVCTLEFAPVVCGPGNCEYSNLCTALLAGFSSEDCEASSPPPAVCPLPGPGICTREFAPVLCEPGSCTYSNICVAQTAGFAAEDCERTTPSPPPVPTGLQKTKKPTKSPTRKPTGKPSPFRTKKPTKRFTKKPTKKLTKKPTKRFTKKPTKRVTKKPTKRVTKKPTKRGTKSPTRKCPSGRDVVFIRYRDTGRKVPFKECRTQSFKCSGRKRKRFNIRGCGCGCQKKSVPTRKPTKLRITY